MNYSIQNSQEHKIIVNNHSMPNVQRYSIYLHLHYPETYILL